MLKRVIAALLTVPLTIPSLTDPAAAAGARGDTVTARLRQAVKNLPVANETRAGYDRDKFNHWVDGDGDCRDTRDEVLAAESLSNVRGCDIQTGRWRSYYDGVVTRDSTSFDIDHLVALAEAGTREREGGPQTPDSGSRTTSQTPEAWWRSARPPTGASRTATQPSGCLDSVSAGT